MKEEWSRSYSPVYLASQGRGMEIIPTRMLSVQIERNGEGHTCRYIQHSAGQGREMEKTLPIRILSVARRRDGEGTEPTEKRPRSCSSVYSACQGRSTDAVIPTCIFSVPRQRDGEGREPIVERPRRVCVAIDQQQCGDHKHGVTQPCNITKQSIKCLREVKHIV